MASQDKVLKSARYRAMLSERGPSVRQGCAPLVCTIELSHHDILLPCCRTILPQTETVRRCQPGRPPLGWQPEVSVKAHLQGRRVWQLQLCSLQLQSLAWGTFGRQQGSGQAMVPGKEGLRLPCMWVHALSWV